MSVVNYRPYFKPGTHKAYCMVCRCAFKADQLKKRWDGLWVCDEDFEHRHPQDFSRGVADSQTASPVLPSNEKELLDWPVNISVDEDGNLITGPEDFSITRNATGDYTATHNRGVSGTYTLRLTVSNFSPLYTITESSSDGNSIRYVIKNSTGTAEDIDHQLELSGVS